MTEFKKLSEVEQIETASNNATVLIETNGEIKRVPKKEVGGAGGYIIDLKNGRFEEVEGVLICYIDDDYDELYEILKAGGSVWIDEGTADPGFPPSMSITAYTNLMIIVEMWTLTNIGLIVSGPSGVGGPIIFPNGSHNIPPAPNLPT